MSGLGPGLENSPGATLAGGKGDWEAAMATWVMIEEAENKEEVLVEETSGGVTGGSGG